MRREDFPCGVRRVGMAGVAHAFHPPRMHSQVPRRLVKAPYFLVPLLYLLHLLHLLYLLYGIAMLTSFSFFSIFSSDHSPWKSVGRRAEAEKSCTGVRRL